MESITLTSKNKTALKAIKAIVKQMPDISIEENKEEDGEDYFYINGVRVTRGKGKLDVEKMASSLSDIKFDDPKTIRKKAWRRKKAEF